MDLDWHATPQLAGRRLTQVGSLTLTNPSPNPSPSPSPNPNLNPINPNPSPNPCPKPNPYLPQPVAFIAGAADMVLRWG